MYLGNILVYLLPLAIPGHAAEGAHGSKSSAEHASMWSREMEAGESLKMSQQMIEDLLFGVGTQLESEEFVMSISSRLQTALEKMLTVISDTTNQVLIHELIVF